MLEGGNDRLYGGAGKDKLFGESGTDYLHGGLDRKADELWGRTGLHTFRADWYRGSKLHAPKDTKPLERVV